ncbi:XkdX family protein [Companilactobacillus nantensis]|nr:XkdX family protein [Companilactobacillus nantensis]GEO64763.1 hypothetical protein LNA01_19460 [Companilactobacillus nantensis]
MIFLLKIQLAWGTRTKDSIKDLVKNKNITADDYKQITNEDYTEEGAA